MDVDAAQALLDDYVDERVTAVDRSAVGVSNETWFVRCASSTRYAVRLVRGQTPDSVRTEATAQRLLRERGIGTPLYLPRRCGDVVGTLDGEPVTVAEVVPGRHPDHASPALVRSIGATLAALHEALDPGRLDVAFHPGQWLDPRNVRDAITAAPAPARAALTAAVRSAQELFAGDLPRAIIHGELATNNVFAEDEHVTVVFDLETLQEAPRILDLAYSWVSVVYDETLPAPEVARALLAGYDGRARRRVTADERARLPVASRFAAAAAAVWCHRRGYGDYAAQFVRAGELAAAGVVDPGATGELPAQ